MTNKFLAPRLELWGGVECTVNRIGDRFFSQLELSGHTNRLQDLDRIAALGVRTLRYPALWEQAAPEHPERIDWSWADQRFGRLRELAIVPIAGLVHHGSGPRYTHLADPSFAPGVARYAGLFAQRFPWIESYTPVNEPLTTARFSGLYGLWYPHSRDPRIFARAIVNQCRATVLSMRAIRAVNPQAKLVQTEDLGRAHGTPVMAYRAEFENERRWLTWDLLCGKVDASHLFWRYLIDAGVDASELQWLFDNPCPPDIIGINHYITGERFLDERCQRYSMVSYENDGVHRYADLEAVRVLARPSLGLSRLLQEAWQRYRLPMAITEAHLGCSREEQMRWLLEVWRTAQAARDGGIDLRAVTAWAMFGTYDWNTLLTSFTGHYEPGVFDVRGHDTAPALAPRPTALAGLVKTLAKGDDPDHPTLAAAGWWQRPVRLLHRPAAVEGGCQSPEAEAQLRWKRCARPLLINGATGTLGQGFARLCELRGLDYRLLSRAEMDIADPSSVEAALDRFAPWAVINAAGYVRVDEAEGDSDRCYRENSEGPRVLAAACARHGLPLVTFSSDLVFDGKRDVPYVENDAVAPLNVYGESKARAEGYVLERHDGALVIRSSAFFGPWDAYNFIASMLATLRSGRPFTAVSDQIVSPTYLPDLINATLDQLLDGTRGVLHLANHGAVSWAEFALRAAELANAPTRRLVVCDSLNSNSAARRPSYSVLGSSRGLFMPSLDDALARFWRDTSVLEAAAPSAL